MKEVGFTPIRCDPGSFVSHGKNGALCVCTVHVDDLFIFYNSQGGYLRDRLATGLSKTLKIKFLGELDSPGDPEAHLQPADEVSDEEVRKWELYPIREIIGSYMWLAHMSRPDILVVLIAART